MLHKLFRKLKRVLRRLQSGPVRAWCPDCWENFNPYQGHDCWGHLGNALALSFEQVEQNVGPANAEYCYNLDAGHTRGWTCQHVECKETK